MSAFWFKNLEADSIGSWADFHLLFMRYWSKNKYDEHYISEFYALKRNEDEALVVFNRRFHTFYLSMPKEIQPSERVAMLQYTVAQYPGLFLYLRERKSSSLDHMFTDAEEIEENCQACGKLPKPFFDEILEQDKVYQQQEYDLEFHSQHAYVSHSSFYSSSDLEINSFHSNYVNDYYEVDFVEEIDEFIQR